MVSDCGSSVKSFASKRSEDKGAVKTQVNLKIPGFAVALTLSLAAWGQTEGPRGYSVATPRPISPAEGTTTPNAQATLFVLIY